MNPREIREQFDRGDIDAQTASDMFSQIHSAMETRQQPNTHVYQPKTSRLPVPGQQISTIQADRQSLSRVRADLSQELQNRDAEHLYQREYVAESSRHAVGLFAYGFIGFMDGILDSVGYGISEFAEDIAFTITRTTRRIKEGLSRGWNG